jgi:hypothetical protein
MVELLLFVSKHSFFGRKMSFQAVFFKAGKGSTDYFYKDNLGANICNSTIFTWILNEIRLVFSFKTKKQMQRITNRIMGDSDFTIKYHLW